PYRIPEGARAAPQQIKFAMPIETIPLGQQLFTVAQLGLPFLSPIGAQTARHDHADESNQPEPKTKAGCLSSISHQSHSLISVQIMEGHSHLRASGGAAAKNSPKKSMSALTISRRVFLCNCRYAILFATGFSHH